MFDRDNALKYFFVQWTHVTSVDHINSLFLPVTHIFDWYLSSSVIDL